MGINGFYMSLDNAMEFYRRCEEKKALTREDKVRILMDMQAEKKTEYMNEDKLKEKIKGKRVLRINGNYNN